MKFDESAFAACEWQWDDGIELLRRLPNLENLEILLDRSIDLYGWPSPRDGQSSFTLATYVDITTKQEDQPVFLLETKDRTGFDPLGMEEAIFPIWENARIVPSTHPLYLSIRAILEF